MRAARPMPLAEKALNKGSATQAQPLAKPHANMQQRSSNSAKRRPSGQLIPWNEASSDEESEDGTDDSSGYDGGYEEGMDATEDQEEEAASQGEAGEGALAVVDPLVGTEPMTIKVTAHHKEAPEDKRVYALWDNMRAMQQVAPGSRRTTPGVFRLCDSKFVPVMEGGKPKFVTGQWLEIAGGFSEHCNKYRSTVRLAEETVVDGKTYHAGREMQALLPPAPGGPSGPRPSHQPRIHGLPRGGFGLFRPTGPPRPPRFTKIPAESKALFFDNQDDQARLKHQLERFNLGEWADEVEIAYFKFPSREQRLDRVFFWRDKSHRSVPEVIRAMQAQGLQALEPAGDQPQPLLLEGPPPSQPAEQQLLLQQRPTQQANVGVRQKEQQAKRTAREKKNKKTKNLESTAVNGDPAPRLDQQQPPVDQPPLDQPPPVLDEPLPGSLAPHQEELLRQLRETVEQMDTDMQYDELNPDHMDSAGPAYVQVGGLEHVIVPDNEPEPLVNLLQDTNGGGLALDPPTLLPYVDYIPASHETNGLTDSGTQDCGRHDGHNLKRRREDIS